MQQRKQYTCMIFDADHTLLDYIADEYAAFERVYRTIGLEISPSLLAASRRYSEETWTEAGLYDVHNPEIQRTYHAVYRSHVEGIFQKVFAQYPCPNPDWTAKKTGELFLRELEKEGNLLPFAEEILKRLSNRFGGAYTVCIATNGLSAIQRGRLAKLEKYGRVYISEEMGFIKPLPPFFYKILQDEGVDFSQCLMVGDSLLSDVAGAKAAHIDACWFNPRKQKNTTAYTPDYEIFSLENLTDIL